MNIRVEIPSESEAAATETPSLSAVEISLPRHKWRLRHVFLGVAAFLFLASIAIYGMRWFEYRAAHVSENDARVAGEVITVASRLDGWLTQRLVMDGDPIRKGQLLAQIDDRDAQERLQVVEASIAAATAAIGQLQAQRDTTDATTQAAVADANAQITAAQAALSAASHRLDLAQRQFKRQDNLLKTGNTSQQNWDNAHAMLLQRQDEQQEATALLQSRKAALINAEAGRGQVQVLDRQIDVQRQQRQALVAQADQIRQEIADRSLRSPVDGVVDRTLADVGDYVQPGQWVMMVHDPDNLWVEANVKETEIEGVAVGQPVRIAIDAYPDLIVDGKVQRVGNAATNQFALLPSPNPSGNFTKITQRVPVRIAIDKPDPRLKPGLMVEVSIDVSH